MKHFVGVCALLVAVPLAGQRTVAVPVRTAPLGWVGAGLAIAQPTGEFGDYVDVGGGLAAHGVWSPVPGGVFGLRADATFILYGSETRRYPLLPLIDVDVTTSNQIFGLNLGPEFSAGTRAFRPYVFGQGGFSYFATSSSVEGSDNAQPFAETTNFEDFTWSATVGGGVRIALADSRHRWALDLGARYVANGRAQYLREGSIVIDGTDVTITPVESETNLILYHIGLSVGLRAAGVRD